MGMSANEIEELIQKALPDAKIIIRSLSGSNDHYTINVRSEAFRDKDRVAQHQMVYQALKGRVGGDLHALALQTGVPEKK